MCDATHLPLPCGRLEGVLLWTMRAWVIGIVEKIPVEEQICDAFAKLGAPAAATQLYEFMWVLSQGAARTIDVDCLQTGHQRG